MTSNSIFGFETLIWRLWIQSTRVACACVIHISSQWRGWIVIVLQIKEYSCVEFMTQCNLINCIYIILLPRVEVWGLSLSQDFLQNLMLSKLGDLVLILFLNWQRFLVIQPCFHLRNIYKNWYVILIIHICMHDVCIYINICVIGFLFFFW